MADKPFVIAIDGPAASGKGTVARRLASDLGYRHLDTGLTYRAVAYALMQKGLPLDNELVAAKEALGLDLSKLDRATLSDHNIGEAASKVAVMSTVRSALVQAQRNFAAIPPGNVLDGRDIGTIVCADADVKFFITASPQVRARRRHDEITGLGKMVEIDEILRDIQKRDERDMKRHDSPLKPAADAHLIDTSNMDIETAFQTVLAIVKDAQAA